MLDSEKSQEQLLRELEELRQRVAVSEQAEAESRRMEKSLQQEHNLLRTLIDLLPDCIYVKDTQSRFLVANKAVARIMSAASPSDLIGKTDQDFYPGRLAIEFGRDERQVIESGEPLINKDEPGINPDGSLRAILTTKVPLRDTQGQIIGLVGIGHDITERKRAEEELRRAHDELDLRVRERTAELAAANEGLEKEHRLVRALMDNLPQSIYFKDAASRFISINRALATSLGLRDAAEAIGKSDADFFTAEHAQRTLADEQQIMRTGRPILDKEQEETWPDGHTQWTLTTKIPFRDEEGRIVGTLGISRDITERKQVSEALRVAKEAAEAASRAKGAFLANMSHEIRTPLNAVIGMTELVLKSPLAAQQREFLELVRESGEALLSLINDILDFSKIEAGKLVLESSAFDLWESLGDTMKTFAVRAHQQGLELVCSIHPEVPRMVVGDYNRLRQILVNLVGNAVKFTERGEVGLEVTREPPAENDVLLHFVVADTGIGIPGEKQAAIFEMFEQADASTTRRHGGTGLGLAIASHLVGLMGGRIWVESEVGRGSRFHFVVRLAPAAAEFVEPLSPEPACLHGMPVLVVDDNATNRRILDAVLRSWQMAPTTARSAAEAIQLLLESRQKGEPFRLVLTDAHMPSMDGFMLAEQIKQDSILDSTVVMMLTSGDRPDDMQRCEDLGISAYLLKPIKQSELLEAIQFALGITVARKELRQAAKRRAPPAAQLRILLAEDSLVNQKLAVALLEEEGHVVAVASNGREACAQAASGNFDLILMDVQMPEMDGLEATAKIRAGEKQSKTHIPIVAMTAHALKGDRERCLEAGMDAYVAKPIRADEVLETIGALIAATGESAAPAVSAPPEEGLVDWTEALRAVRGDYRLLRVIVEAAAKEIPSQVTAIREAIAGGNATAVQLAAHTLKGAIRYFASGAGFEQVRSLEKMGQNKNLEGAEQCLARLEAEVQPLIRGLADYLRRS
jgi:PAS domain S-box-containing protein